MHSQSDKNGFTRNSQPHTSTYPTTNIINTTVAVKPQSDNDYSYTSFKRQAPILRNPPVAEQIISQPLTYTNNIVPITPSFKQLNHSSRVDVVSPNIVIPTPAVNYSQASFPIRNQSLSTTVGKSQFHQRNLSQNINLTGVAHSYQCENYLRHPQQYNELAKRRPLNLCIFAFIMQVKIKDRKTEGRRVNGFDIVVSYNS